MVNIKSLGNMYDAVVDGEVLTVSKLKSFGFSLTDIIRLVDEKFIISRNNDTYELARVDDLYDYAKKILNRGDYVKGKKYLEKCYEINPSHYSTCFQLFFESIKDKNYDMAFKCLDIMFNTDDIYRGADNNFYLYLLSIITDVPDRYKEYARNLEFKDFEVEYSDINHKDVSSLNIIRQIAVERKFFYAVTLLKQLTTSDTYSFHHKIIKTMFYQAGDVEKESKQKVFDLAVEKKYHDIVLHYENKNKRHKLSPIDIYTLKVAKDIIDIEQNIYLPKRIKMENLSTFDAIDTHNYEYALKSCANYNKNLELEKSSLYVLLEDLCKLYVNVYNINKAISSMKYGLETNDYENIVKIIKGYMRYINKKEYEFLVIDYLKLSILEGDNELIKLKKALLIVSKDNINFDLQKHIDDYRLAMSNNRYDEACIYLDIISKLNDNYDINGLQQEFKQLFNVDKNIILEQIDKYSQQEFVSTEDEELIEQKHNYLLENKGIVLLRPTDKVQRKKLKRIVARYPDIMIFSIGSEPKKLVLRYRNKKIDYVNYKYLADESDNAYFNGNYSECIKYNMELLQYGYSKVKPYVRIGMSYLKLGQKELALMYLTVANEMSKTENLAYEFDDIINTLEDELCIKKQSVFVDVKCRVLKLFSKMKG